MDDASLDSDLKLQTEPTQDELIIQQHREIEKEISDTIKLIGEKESLKTLEDEYKNDDVYASKIKSLLETYDTIRKTRPDGNCFFRAFGFGYFEQLMYNEEKFKRFEDFARSSKDRLISMGFPSFTLEDFHDIFMEVVSIVGRGASAAPELHRVFNEQGYSDYVVVYLRLLTSAHLQQNDAFFHSFIEGDRTVADFCHQEVEVMYRESDHIHITALSEALGAGVRVCYMDRGGGAQLNTHDFPSSTPPSPPVHLLYRPGHYDLLYPH